MGLSIPPLVIASLVAEDSIILTCNGVKRKTRSRIMLMKLFWLIFLDPDDVSAFALVDAFVFEFVAIRPENDAPVRFSNYLIVIYGSEDATYPTQLWACTSSSYALNTNSCEGFQSQLNKTSSLHTSYLSSFWFLGCLPERNVHQAAEYGQILCY